MNLTTIIISVTFIGLLFQYLIDFLIKKDVVKRIVGAVILLFTLASLIISLISQEKGKSELNGQLQHIDSTNVSLNTVLKLRNRDLEIIKIQNDSLKYKINELSKSQNEFLTITKENNKELKRFSQSIKDFQNAAIQTDTQSDLLNRPFSRGISPIDKIKMRDILKKHVGSKITITTMLGDPEAFQFADQIKEVFINSGWEVDGINQAIYNRPVVGLKIKVKNRNYPSRVNTIIAAFNLLRLQIEGWLDESYTENQVELIVGSIGSG